MLKKLFTLFLILVFVKGVIAQDYRYTEDQFNSVTVISDVVYGTAPFLDAASGIESNITVDNLLMDIYLPDGDSNTMRPVIVFAHGGGFITGNKNHDDMVAFCELYAKKGYVTVSIDYRQGFYFIGNVNMHAIRAVYRGLQDGKSAVRFLRANASTYGIDPDKVYFAGSSAGAFIGLHSIYMDDLSEKPLEAGQVNYSNIIFPFNHTAPDLGDFDVGDNLNFRGEPDALVSLWGAVQNTNLINAEDDESVFLVHGHDDATVPFNSGPPFSIPLLNNVDGSNLIKNRLDNIGLTNNETYFVEGQGHEFYGASNGAFVNGEGNEFWDIIADRTTMFLWNEHKPIANFESSATGLEINFSDTSTGALSWLWDFGDGSTSSLQNPSHTFANEGDYEVKLYIENDILSWNETTKTITAETLSVTEFTSLGFTYFPNPTSDVFTLKFDAIQDFVKVRIHNVSGQLIQQKNFMNTSSAILNIEEYAPNLYFVSIETEANMSQIKILKN